MPVLELLVRGGWLMVPIGIMSVVVVALGVERALALRRSQVLPTPLATSLEEMADRQSADAISLRRLCGQFPSSAARVAESVLHKIGRPAGELERSLGEAAQREADRLYTNVRTLNLASTITPLLGLLGTVWGMIQAFFATANMPIGSNKGQALAEGIYVALVTTFAALSVAIPAAVLAHVFETRILRLLRDVEQLLGGLLPQLDRRDGQLRIDEPHELPGPMTTPRPTVRRDAKAS
jgi:biopolymer transport protein ExbB